MKGVNLMSFEEEFQEAYEAKNNDDINFMNTFCGKWDGKAEQNQIPYFIRLFNDYAMTSEQNEFVAIVINNIVKKDPKRGTKIIFENMNLLESEDSMQCITYLLCILVSWNQSYLENTAREFANYEQSLNKEISSRIIKKMKAGKHYEQFLLYYDDEKEKLS